jgi:hypothetical protein
VRIDSVLDDRFHRIDYDTNYIGRPPSRLTLKVRGNLSGNRFRVRGNIDGRQLSSDLATDSRATVSFGINYKGIAAGIAVNPSSLTGRDKDYELNVNVYTNRYSLDASYQISKTLSGDIFIGNEVRQLIKGSVETRILNIAGYYTFNHRRFSYPAAFTQSYIQKRSSGSWLVGFSYQGGTLKSSPDESDMTPEARFYVGHIAIGGGYGYNFVPGSKWLFHLSALPTLVVYNRSNVTINGERQRMRFHFPEVILNERASIVYTINPRYFLGVTFVAAHSFFSANNRSVHESKWRTRLILGIRL